MKTLKNRPNKTTNQLIGMKKNIIVRIFNFYREGFQTMENWSRRVWIIILIKLFIMFFILRMFFFPNFLKENYKNDNERALHVLEELTY